VNRTALAEANERWQPIYTLIEITLYLYSFETSSSNNRPDGAMVARQIPESISLVLPEGWVFKSLSGHFFFAISFAQLSSLPLFDLTRCL
jgi:hypothetical protein